MKLYSELAERENRFFLSLEISFPFVLVIALLAYLLNSINFEWQDRILFVVLVLCYIYYVVYLIYYGFNSTLLDDKSGAFSRDEIIKIISKEIHKPNQNVVLLNISNLQDISQRYGHKNGDKIDKIFKTSLRNLLEILTPKRGDTNKNRWYKTKWWEKFLEYDETIDFSLAERDVMLGDLLEWLRVAVLPSLSLLEIIGNERGFDIYDLLQKAEKSTDFSKKQNRLYVNSQTLSDETINHYLSEFLGGGK